MNERGEVRRRVERLIGRRVPDAIWRDRYVEGVVEEIITGISDPDETFDHLLEAIKDRIRLVEEAAPELFGEELVKRKVGAAGQQKQAGHFDPDTFTGPRTRAMTRAMSEFYVGLADQHPKVEEFRNDVLRGKLLTDDEAHGLLSSFAARILGLDWFRRWEIPIVGHTSELVGEYDVSSSNLLTTDHRVSVRIDPPGITLKLRYADPRTSPGEEIDDTRCMAQNGAIVPPPRYLPVKVYGDYAYPPHLWPGSVTDNLYDLAQELTETFDWPEEDSSAWFVLTGKVPQVRPLDARWEQKNGSKHIAPQWRIRLTVPPWLPAEEVSRAYRLMQDRILEGKNRLPDPKTLEAARFVWEQQKLNEYRKPPWTLLWERWNAEHPGSRFETYNNFRQYCVRGAAAVIKLNFSMPRPRMTPPK